jgi:BRCA1 C Terminus (BRCT) domain/DNA repair protein Crb2 Tudor domain
VEEVEAHDDEMDIIGDQPPKTRKRKREAARSKPVVKREKKTKVTPPPMKVLRSGVASAKKNHDPTRVLALWATDKHYYTGTVEYVITGSQYEISFDDRNHAPVSLDGLRALDFEVGDELEYKKKKCPVVSASRVPQGFITILHERKHVDVPLEDIRISSKLIAGGWEDRRLEAESIVPHCQPGAAGQGTSSRAKSGNTAAAVQEARATKPVAKLLQGIAFVLSFGGKEDDPQRNSLVSKIVKAGGKVVGFDQILPADGRNIKKDQSWHATRDQLQWQGDAATESLYLLASEATKRPKYLTALALGIPCVSHEWIETSLAHVRISRRSTAFAY